MSFASALKEAFLPTLFARSCDILAFKCDPYLLKARVVVLLKEYRRYFSALKLIAKIPQKRVRYTIFLSYFAPRLVWFRVKKRIKLLFVAESSIDSAISQNLNQNNSVRSTQTRPLRGAKNRIQGCSSATADFLLEADKRGSPPKSEKRQLLGTHLNNSWGEREQGGAALLRKESNELSGDGGAESSKDYVDSQNLGEKSNKKIFSKVFASFCFCKKKNPSNPLDSNSSNDLDSAKSGDLRG